MSEDLLTEVFPRQEVKGEREVGPLGGNSSTGGDCLV